MTWWEIGFLVGGVLIGAGAVFAFVVWTFATSKPFG